MSAMDLFKVTTTESFMEKLDVIVIPAGEVIHFHGMPVQLTENIRALGRKENFRYDATGFIAVGAAGEEQTSE